MFFLVQICIKNIKNRHHNKYKSYKINSNKKIKKVLQFKMYCDSIINKLVGNMKGGKINSI